MDDPWANAWDESHSKNTTSAVPTKSIFSTSTWRDPAENETDIALPSWSVGPAVTWNEPSDDAPTLWGSSTSNDSPELPITSSFSPKGVDWKSSYESMSAHFGSSSVDENSETEEVGDAEESNEGEGMHDQIDVNVDEYEAVAAKGEAPGIVDPWTPPQSTFPTSTSLSSVLEITASNSPPAPRSPDAFEFGTFESGASDSLAGPSTEGKTWDSGSLSNPESEWGTAWTSKEADSNDVEDVEALDEWERAKREKEKMDRVVVSFLHLTSTLCISLKQYLFPASGISCINSAYFRGNFGRFMAPSRPSETKRRKQCAYHRHNAGAFEGY